MLPLLPPTLRNLGHLGSTTMAVTNDLSYRTKFNHAHIQYTTNQGQMPVILHRTQGCKSLAKKYPVAYKWK